MKTIKIFTAIFVVCGFISCQAKKENSDILLTDFTQKLISMYISDIENFNAKNRKDEIIVISVVDTSYYYLSVFSNNSKEYKFCREDFVGQTLYLGHSVKIFGDESSIFYSVKNTIKTQKKCKDVVSFYDPSVWRFCLHNDQSFCKMQTYKVTKDGDISVIQNLAAEYFNTLDTVCEMNKNKIYQFFEVENEPKFALGEDSLRHLISSNFEIKRSNIQGKVPVVVDIVIDKNGNATLRDVKKSSNDREIDREALRITGIICQYKFTPASHRGEKVNVIFPIMFLLSDMSP